MNGYLILGWIFLVVGICCYANFFYSLYLIFRTRLVVDLPLDQKFKNFTVTKKGGYAIWQEGPLFQQAPMTFSTPQIKDVDHNQVIKLSKSYSGATKNGFSRGSVLAFYCELTIGNYCLEVSAGSSLNVVEDKISQSLIHHLPIKKAPESQYSFQIRESLTRKQRIFMFIYVIGGTFLFVRGLFTIIHLTTGVPMEGSLV